MSVEPIGALTVICGMLALLMGYRATSAVFIVATLLGSAAALLIGGANIQPAHLLLGFVAIGVLSRPNELESAIRAIASPRQGFWLVCLVIYGVVSAVVMPRLLAGTTPIIPLGTSDYASTGSTVPIGPVSSNFTQSVYFIGDVICFAMVAAVASSDAGFKTIVGALIAYAAGNAIFALIDLGTYFTGTQWTLEFIRNAQYTLHNEEEVGGLKRIVGSFPEASAFARSTLGALGFTGTLWICGYRPVLTGWLALASLALVILSTSSTGIVSTPPVVALLYATALFRNGFNQRKPYQAGALLCAPLIVAALVLAVLLSDGASERIGGFLDTLIFNKSQSDSGIERSSWNRYAIQNFFDSNGFGVGLGTARTSSFPVALLSNVGVPGTLFYLLFFVSTFGLSRGVPRTFYSNARMAARNTALALTIGDLFAAPVVEQGILFYVLAALACSEPERNMANLPAPVRPVRARA